MINKNKPDALRNKILFINADAEYGEGKAQNFLRPEDIEKIDTAFSQQLEIPKYSRLVDLKEIEENDFNLNIRRYVDNTPEPEPEDVRAHLIGGVPKSEVATQEPFYHKFKLKRDVFFQEKDEQYYDFNDDLKEKAQIKERTEAHSGVKKTLDKFRKETDDWWKEAKDDFINLEEENNLPKIRLELLGSFQKKLQPLELFDRFQIAGIFVNWWQSIFYDLKTISSYGWSVNLIPDAMIKKAFFQKEMDELDKMEAHISDLEGKLQEAMEAAEVEPETDDDGNDVAISVKYVTATLTSSANDLLSNYVDKPGKLKLEENGSTKLPKEVPTKAQQEIMEYLSKAHQISDLEAKLRAKKKSLKEQSLRLEDLVDAKKYGRDGYINHLNALIVLHEAEIAAAEKDPAKKKIQKEIDTLNAKKELVEELISAIGQPITDVEARDLILQKHHEVMQEQLNRYLNTEKRNLIFLAENLWEKYAVSSQKLENDLTDSLKELNTFLIQLNYLN